MMIQGFTEKLLDMLTGDSKTTVEQAAEKSEKAAEDVKIKF